MLVSPEQYSNALSPIVVKELEQFTISSLTNIDFPYSLTKIGNFAFNYCVRL